MRRKRRVILWPLLLVPVAALALWLRLLPLVESMAAAQVENEASDLIAEAIAEQMALDDICYSSVVQLEKDGSGRLLALRTDRNELNRLRSETLSIINRRLLDAGQTQLGFPLGNVFLPSLCSGHGPQVPVRIITVSNADAEFVSGFQEAGINQTLHQITMQVALNITMLTPAGTKSLHVGTDVVVAETVLIGQVPNTLVQRG